MFINKWVQHLMLFWGLGIFAFSGLQRAMVLPIDQCVWLLLMWVATGVVYMCVRQTRAWLFCQRVALCVEGGQVFYLRLTRHRKRFSVVDAGCICRDPEDSTSSTVHWPKGWQQTPLALAFCGERVLIKPLEIPNVAKNKAAKLAEYEASFRYPWLLVDWMHGFYAAPASSLARNYGIIDVAGIFWHKKECMLYMEKTPWDKLPLRHVEPSLLALWRASQPLLTESLSAPALVCAYDGCICTLLVVQDDLPQLYVTWQRSLDIAPSDVRRVSLDIVEFLHVALHENALLPPLGNIVFGGVPGDIPFTALLCQHFVQKGLAHQDVNVVSAEQILTHYLPGHGLQLMAPHAVALGLILEEFHHAD